MKINENMGIITLIAAIFLAFFAFESGIMEAPQTGITLDGTFKLPAGFKLPSVWLYVPAIAAGIYLIILTKRYLDAKMSETKEETYSGVLILVASLVLAMLALRYGDETDSAVQILFFVFILPLLAMIINYWFRGLSWANKVGEQRIKQQTVREEEITSKIKLLNERARGIENKLEKIEWILKKVSD